MILWILGIFFCLLIVVLAAFVLLARKGRALRRSQPLPPEAQRGFLEWSSEGKAIRQEVIAPFYFGKNPKSDVVLLEATVNFELCIFYHQDRFAFQALDGAREVFLNGQEVIAGYLRDGDTLRIAQQCFLFRCD